MSNAFQLEYTYRLENLSAFSAGTGIGTFDFLFFLILTGAYVFFSLFSTYLYAYYKVKQKEYADSKKKDHIKNLILMKNIQGELEREMKEALLNSALIGKDA